MLALVWFGCVSPKPTPTEPKAIDAIAPTFSSLHLRAANADVEAMVRQRLATLSACPAYVTRFFREGLRSEPFLLRAPESLDDRTSVSL